MTFCYADELDIPFISHTYNENIQALHGNQRSYETWKNLLSDNTVTYYVVKTNEPVAWFRVEEDDGILWLGMLQVPVRFQRQGIGRKILSFMEELAEEKSIYKIGIHTTEDNEAARSLYQSAGYTVEELGKCTTADGMERIGYTFSKNLKSIM